MEELARSLAELPFQPSPLEAVRVGFELAGAGPGDVLADLGCGDGRVLVYAGGLGVYSVGFELNPVLVRMARRRVLGAGVGGLVDVVLGDLFLADLSRFTLVYVYPSPVVARRVAFKLRGECGRGCRAVVYRYALEGLEPAAQAVVRVGGGEHRVFLYRF